MDMVLAQLQYFFEQSYVRERSEIQTKLKMKPWLDLF